MARNAESTTERFDRFSKVQAAATPMRSTLEEIYNYVAPNRVNFNRTKDQGEILTSQVWNSTAIAGVRAWANNVQSILMPPFKRWYKLVPGNLAQDTKTLSEGAKETLKTELEDITRIAFENLNQSNAYQVLNESLQDLAISTGVIAINEEKGAIPFSFIAVPIDQVYFEESGKGQLNNFWRLIHIKSRFIQHKWDTSKLTLSSALENIIKNSPNEEVELIEGAIEYPDNERGFRFFYYVQDFKTKQDILTEWREYNPFIGFRINKRPGDIYGHSIAQEYFPDIRVLNLISYYILKSAKFKAFPAYLATNSGALNPYTAIIEPGSIIPINPDFYNNPPIMPLDSGGDPQFAQLSVQELEKRISDAFMTNPLGDIRETADRTATEMQLRQQNWIRSNATGIGRLANELIKPIINTVLTILRKNGIIEDVSAKLGGEQIGIDQTLVWIDYQSPLVGIQSQDDAQNLMGYIQSLVQLYGASALAVINNELIPTELAEKLNISLKFIKTEDQTRQILDRLVEAATAPPLQQQKLQALAGQEQPPGAALPASQTVPQMPQGEL